MAGSSGRDPKWLQPLWAKKKSDTARRVEQAVRELLRHKEPVTLNAIRNSVETLFGISISANTIQRNESAYAVYQKHRTARRLTRPRNQALSARLQKLPLTKAVNLRAKINRLRRESKDALIARLLDLQEERARQADREDALREQILQSHPSLRKKGKES
jgi:hypothetical protein